MAKNLVDGTNIIIEENSNNISLNLSNAFDNSMKQTIEEEIIKNNVFSSTETVIGTFVDGKPIYRKVYITQTTNDMNLYLNHYLSDLDRFWLDTANSFVWDSNECLPSNWYYTSSDWGRHWVNKTQIRFRCPGNLGTGRLLYSTVNYTKTTD